MKVTTRDLFNHINPASSYKRFLKEHGLSFEDMPDEMYLDIYPNGVSQRVSRSGVLEAKQHGNLEGEQVQHERSNDEVDCGD